MNSAPVYGSDVHRLQECHSQTRQTAIAILSVAFLVCNLPLTADADPASPDSIRRTTHFLENATFGPTAAEISAVLAVGIDAWLEQQFAQPESPMPDGLDTNQVRARLYLNMANGSDQLRQRVMFALSQTLVVSANKTNSGPELIPWIRMLSTHAFGNYRTLLGEVATSPTMGKYLDLAYSRKATTTTSPNENFARELLQLFSLGLWELSRDGSPRLDGANQPIPTYTQATIREVARALTGWTFPTQPGSTPATSNPQYFVGRMEPRETRHDTEAKSFFGATLPSGQSAVADMQATLDVIFAHSNVPPFIATRLIRSLVTSNPSPAYIERVANVFADNGSGVRGDLRAVVRAVLTDEEALRFSAADSGRLKDPLLHIIGLGRALGARVTDPNNFMWVFQNLSQRVLTPATVFSFYSPLGTLPGTPSLFAPEFQIYPPALAIQRANFIYGILAGWYSSAFAVDLSPFTSVASNVATLVSRVDHSLMFGRMSADLRQALSTATSKISASNVRERALGALYLTALSSEYSVSSDMNGDGIASLQLPVYVPPSSAAVESSGSGGAPSDGAADSSGGDSGGGGSSGGGDMSGGTMPADPPPVRRSNPAGTPDAPANFAGVADGSRLVLTWQNTSDNAASVILDVAGPIVTSVPLGLVDRFEYAGVPDGTYTFTVRAVNAAGSSEASSAVTLSFPGQGGRVERAAAASAACASVPAAPTNLVSSVVGSTVSLAWQSPVSTSVQFIVDVRGSYVGSFESPAPSLVGAAPPGTYIVSVRARNACGLSAASPSITVVVR